MDGDAHRAGGDDQQIESIPVPTAGQVLVRTLPASVLLLAGLPLLAWPLLDDAGEVRTPWWPLAFIVGFAAVVLVQRITQAPRPRLYHRADRKSLDRWLIFTSRSGRLPEAARTRAAVGEFACLGLEGQVATVVLALGALIAVLLRPEFPWFSVVTIPAVLAVISLPRARRSWRYLKALHPAPRAS